MIQKFRFNNQGQPMEMRIETITPEIAAKYLGQNDNNRPLQPSWVKRLTESMLRNEWTINGEAIKIGVSGNVLDGQHRLHAIIKSGASIQTVVMHNVSDQVFLTLDQGKRRSASDGFAIEGYTNTNTLAAATRAAYAISHGGDFGKYLSVPLMQSILMQHPSLPAWTAFFRSKSARNLFQSSIIAVAALAEEKHGHASVLAFMEPLFSGINIDSESPMLVLRQRMIESRASRIVTRAQTQAAYSIKTWNAYITNKKIGVLRWKSDEVFPVLK